MIYNYKFDLELANMNKRSSSHSSSSDSDQKPLPKMLDNKYMIIKNLGGTVNTRAHLVKDINGSETLAIKIAEKGEKQELEKEYDILSSFDHPNIIKPHVFVSEGSLSYYDDRKELGPKTDEEAVVGDKL
jgi:serine/threonine protein kinase